MDLHFGVGDKFYVNDGVENILFEIVNIDSDDDEFPYECYPVETIEKTKEILANGVLKVEDNELYEFKDNDGEVYEFYKDNSLRVVLDDWFVHERWCCSDYEVLEYKYEQVQKELDTLKNKVGLVEEFNSEVDYDLLDKIEKDEEGFVTDNVDEFFNYMFSESEEWTFKELVALLTLAMKEELIFGGKWNGELGKVDGKYYYHPDVESLTEKPGVKLGSRSDDEIAEYLGLEGEYEHKDELVSAAKVVEAKYAGDSFIGYGLLCDFESTPFLLEDENDCSLEKIEEINGVVVYRKMEKEDLSRAVDELIDNATRVCESVNKDGFREDLDYGK